MSRPDGKFIDVGYMDRLSRMDTLVHRLDSRSKLLVTLAYVITVVSFDKYQVSALIPFIVYPVIMMSLAGIPAGVIIKRLILAAPFALLVGIFNPILDREVVTRLGPVAVSGGWISFLSVFTRFVLTVMAALILLATTGIQDVCMALERFRVPRILTTQLLFLYRYIFVLIHEGLRMARARAVRSFGNKGMGMRVYSQMAGSLLMRSLDRSQRLHAAMSCRGFDGQIRIIHQLHWKLSDTIFTGGWILLFVLLRIWNPSVLIGKIILENIK